MSSSNDWINDLSWSNRLFLTEVWPRIREICGGGDIRPVEIIKDNALARELDLYCGIDIWQTIKSQGSRGIASRVQNNTNKKYKGKNWRTFTIRYKRKSGHRTEYAKRKEAIESGKFIYPYLTCQAYFDFDRFIGCGVARTVDIFDAIDLSLIKKSDNEFLVVPYGKVRGVKEIK